MSNENVKKVIQEIISDGMKLTQDAKRLRSICEDSGIQVDDSFAVIHIEEDPLEALKYLFKNLMGLPVIKIAAKMVAQKSGVNL